MKSIFWQVVALGGILLTRVATDAADPSQVVCKVNGKEITAADVEFTATTQHVKPDERTAREPQLVDRLIERQLIRGFLAKQKVSAPADELQLQIEYVESVLKKLGEDPQKFLAKLGYTPERMKEELGLPLAWQVHVRKAVTVEQIRKHFDAHKSELDGTQLRARQVFLKRDASTSEADLAAKAAKLKDVRDQVLAKKMTFEVAAQKFSEAPSKDQGGDVGRFGFRGKLPAPVSRAAFTLKVNEISEPVVSTFGVHLVQVTERHPGDLSLEDVRSQIVERLSEQLWSETVEKERKVAKIERMK